MKETILLQPRRCPSCQTLLTSIPPSGRCPNCGKMLLNPIKCQRCGSMMDRAESGGKCPKCGWIKISPHKKFENRVKEIRAHQRISAIQSLEKNKLIPTDKNITLSPQKIMGFSINEDQSFDPKL